MALNWDVSEVKDWEKVTKQNPITHALVWLSLTCGYSKITEENWEEVFKRVHMYEQSRGVMTYDSKGEDRPVTPADVKSHIGLKTNASAYSTPKFKEHLWKLLLADAGEVLRRYKDAECKKQQPS